ncbi:unnamed protein product [Durusdinium trenchii]|uniref:Metallophosphoesterase domain-containing protein 1 (Adult brain protein 239) (239AB) n=2 Tax=Durusdinium trenchii TaxID=1381693 RepID=A0ABP0HPZ0_9DINO
MAFRPALVTGKLQACLRIARGGAQAFHGPFWSPAARQRRGFSVDRLKESLALHAEVSRCVFIENVAYVVRKQESTKAMLLDESVGDWELEKHLMRKATDWGIPQELVPKVRVLDELPGPESFVVPFSLLRMLHVLFQEVDASQSNHICLQEFLSFCKKTQIFTADEASQVFLSKRSLPSTSELLFSENDIFHLNNEYDTDKAIKFNDFQQLILDAGILDFTSFRAIGDPLGSPLVSFFVDERVLQIILAHWFALYDFNQDGRLQLEEYARLVADYQLPLTAADEIYTRAIKDRMVGLDMLDFQALLVKSGVLATGTSIEKDDEMGRNWRQIEASQQFLVPQRVFIADGRSGTFSPPKGDGHLRFVCLSDTHGQHRELSSRLPPGDVLLHGGDFSNEGSLEEVMDFAAWLRSLPYRYKVLIAGNHELTFDQAYTGDRVKGTGDVSVRSVFLKSFDASDGVIYLEDEEVVLRGVRIYGTPWQPEFLDWAFNVPRQSIKEKWKVIPENLDVLLVHGPPLGRGDALMPSMRRRGCMDLLLEVQERIKPQFCVFGHIHEGAGVTFDGTTHFVNASSMNEHYQCIHAPLVFDIPTV